MDLAFDRQSIDIVINRAFEPFFAPKRYKVSFGGRGGGKTKNIALILILMAMQKKLRILCCREIQKSIKDSVYKTLLDIINEKGLKYLVFRRWKATETSLTFPNGSEFIFVGLKNNVNQIKSYEAIDICWVEEAQSISYESLRVLKPTIRKDGSEIWFSFNRETENDPVYEDFCVSPLDDTLVVEVNYYDNPFFTKALEAERLRDLKKVENGQIEEEDYNHTWLGKPKAFGNSAYYGKVMRIAEENQHICRELFDEGLKVHTVWDLGVNDSTSIIFFQYFGSEIRIIDYYENSGEGLPFYVDVIEKKGYKYGHHFAPFDINVREFSTGVSRLETASQLGLDFYPLQKQNNILDGIHRARLNFHKCWFDGEKTQFLLKCLKNYRKEFDEIRQIYKDKPLHDWTSHCADSFRYLFLAVDIISPLSGYEKTEAEFDEDYDINFGYKPNKITGY